MKVIESILDAGRNSLSFDISDNNDGTYALKVVFGKDVISHIKSFAQKGLNIEKTLMFTALSEICEQVLMTSRNWGEFYEHSQKLTQTVAAASKELESRLKEPNKEAEEV